MKHTTGSPPTATTGSRFTHTRRLVFLFLSGVFFGGAVDHLILAAIGSPLTPYGLDLGAAGNWWLTALDAVIAVIFFVLSRKG